MMLSAPALPTSSAAVQPRASASSRRTGWVGARRAAVSASLLVMSLCLGVGLMLPVSSHAQTAAASPAAAPVPLVKAPQVANPKRVLIIGNSYQYYNNSLHNHLRRMVETAGIHTERELQYKSSTIGGASLDHHPVEWLTTPGRIGVREPFEVVVLQGGSSEPLSPARAERFLESVRQADKTIRSRGGRTALYMTHAYTPKHREYAPDHTRRIESLYVKAGNEVGALVIPVGLAFEEAYRRHPELVLHDKDATHPSLHGTYLAACTALAALYGVSPVGNSYTYDGAVDAATARQLQQVAQDVVTAFFKR